MKWVSSVLVPMLVLAALFAPVASAAPGELDPSFGTGGKAKLLHSNAEIILPAVATQPDGKVVLAGLEGPSRILVARLDENGSLDQSFGEGGTAHLNVFEGSFLVRAVAIQPDGKIVAAGSINGAADRDFVVGRFTANGKPDTTFGTGAVEVVPVGPGNDQALAVAIGQGGRILLTGSADMVPGPGVEVGVAVLKEDGKPDPSFNGTGVKTLATTGEEKNDEGVAIAEQPDGKIVVGDESGNGRGNGFTLIRMLPGGGLDSFFGAGGIANTPIPGAVGPQNAGRVLDLALLPDGKIVTSGYGFNEVVTPKVELDEKFAAVRYLANGIPDPSFGGAGTGIFTRQLAEFDDHATDVEVDTSGRTLISGPYVSGNDGIAIIRLDSSGLPDPTFGSAGLVKAGGGEYHDAAIDSQERLVVASTAFEEGMTTSVEATRFLGGPPLQPAPPGPSQGGGAKTGTPPAVVIPVPHARMKAVPRKLRPAKLTGFSGTASDAGGGVAKVQIALVKLGAARAGRAGTCPELKNAKGRFKAVKAKAGNCPLLWLNATGTAKWSFKLKSVLPIGRYVVYTRAIDASGLAETTFSRAAGNRYGFRLLAP